MKYLSLFSPHNLALISDWLAETNELFVDVYMPHSGGGSAGYFIRSMDEFKSLISRQNWNEIVITVFRGLQFPLRGVADEAFLELCLKQIPDGQFYEMVALSLSQFPSNVAFCGEGKTHSEFRVDFNDRLGEEIGIGAVWPKIDNMDWIISHPHEIFSVDVVRNNQFQVRKNQDYYESYAKNPERYQWVIDLWQT